MGSTRSDDGSATHKERLRWTQQLHDLFVEAVNRLGGPDSKSLCCFFNQSSDSNSSFKNEQSEMLRVRIRVSASDVFT